MRGNSSIAELRDDSTPIYSCSATSVPAQDDLQSLRNLTSHLATEAASSDPSSAKLLSLFESQNELRDREQHLQRQQEAL